MVSSQQANSLVPRESSRLAVIVSSILIQVVAFVVGVIFAGGGHGTYHALRALFPYSMLVLQLLTSDYLNDSVPANPLEVLFVGVAGFAFIGAWVFVFVQYPFYGIAVVIFRKYRGAALVIWIIVAIHVATAAVAFLLGPRNAFWP